MREWLSGRPNWRRIAVQALLGAGVLGASSVALGLPWDVDMADGQQRKGYSFEMKAPPAGAVAQPSLTSPNPYTPNYVRGTPEGNALPLPSNSDETVAQGKKMYETYCAPCHGVDGINLGAVAQPGRLPGVLALAGPAGVAKLRSDGYIYLTIRNGGAVMPAYGWAMTDDEMWSTVAYVRTLKDAAAPAPAPNPQEQP
ncbi:MAG: cytochrome c [Myxococcota bacterium]